MADLTVDTPRKYKLQGVRKIGKYPMAVCKIHEGGFVSINASGYAENGDNDSNFVPVGICKATVDNTGGSAGDLIVEVIEEGSFELPVTGVTAITDVGASVYIVGDDNAYTLSSTNNIKVGVVEEFISTGNAYVFIQSATLRV